MILNTNDLTVLDIALQAYKESIEEIYVPLTVAKIEKLNKKIEHHNSNYFIFTENEKNLLIDALHFIFIKYHKKLNYKSILYLQLLKDRIKDDF